MKKRAYITDLDGTLLRSDQTLSPYTVDVLKQALQKGLVISFATARGCYSAMGVVGSIPWPYPVVLYNGALLYDARYQKVLGGYWLDGQLSNDIIDIGRKRGVLPFYFSLDVDDRERVLHEELTRAGETAFYESRKGDPRFMQVGALSSPTDHRTLALTFIGLSEELEPIHREVKDRFGDQVHSHIMKDYYIADHYFLEFSHPCANKKDGLKLWASEMKIPVENIVVFGDNLNDLDMFQTGGTKIAVRNAHKTIQGLADHIIETNNEDGVARFLERAISANAG